MLVAALAIGAGIIGFIHAQESPTYKVDVNVVNVLATVRDRDGHIVSNLSKFERDLRQGEYKVLRKKILI